MLAVASSHHSKLSSFSSKLIFTILPAGIFTRLKARSVLVGPLVSSVLPYSIWPPNPIGKKLLINYHNPLGQPVLAVLEAGYYHDTNTLAYSPFSSHFQRYHIPRITMNTQKALNYLVDHRQQVPVAQSCRLGPVDPARAADPAYLSGLVKDAVQSALCPHAYYSVSGFYFDASGQTVIQGQLAPIGE